MILPLDSHACICHSGAELTPFLHFVSATPGYVPPPATFDSEAMEAVPSINAVGPARKRNGKKA